MTSPTRQAPQANGTPPAFIPSGFVMRHIVNPITVRLGGPALVVRGRRSGRLITTPVPPFEFEGARYLVGGRGETHWVRNLRAAGEGELRRGSRREPFRAVELTPDERDRVLAAYRERMGRRVRPLFDALPEPSQHPVFRIEPPAATEHAGA
jgi:deazaflavin-dependent oxidoreductase (nitroreductase family)